MNDIINEIKLYYDEDVFYTGNHYKATCKIKIGIETKDIIVYGKTIQETFIKIENELEGKSGF